MNACPTNAKAAAKTAAGPRRALVLDCDGVILDTNAMKTAAFGDVLRAVGHPAPVVDAFSAYQRGQFGRSRYRLFEDFFERFAGRTAVPGEMDDLLVRFAARCREGYARAKLTAGAEAFLDRAAGLALFICSGSDQAELRAVFAERGLSDRFEAILGSPTAKADNLRSLAKRGDLDIVGFVGDAVADHAAAAACGVPFAFVSGYAADPAPLLALAAKEGFPVFETLGDLARIGTSPDGWPPLARRAASAPSSVAVSS